MALLSRHVEHYLSIITSRTGLNLRWNENMPLCKVKT